MITGQIYVATHKTDEKLSQHPAIVGFHDTNFPEDLFRAMDKLDPLKNDNWKISRLGTDYTVIEEEVPWWSEKF